LQFLLKKEAVKMASLRDDFEPLFEPMRSDMTLADMAAENERMLKAIEQMDLKMERSDDVSNKKKTA
jgi:hypothetical protein